MEKKINKKRFFVDAINKAAHEQGIEVSWISDNWICTLKKGEETEYIYGYNFSLNSATAFEIGKDKGATYQLLKKELIPAVEHRFLERPGINDDKDQTTIISEIIKDWNFPLVCKNNRGAGGYAVFKSMDRSQLDEDIMRVWNVSRSAALCPFYDIENEYRFFVLDNQIEFVYKKIKPDTEWKFNLNLGSKAEIVPVDNFLEMSRLVLNSVQKLNLNVCSVDVVKLVHSDAYLVLEVNTGICTEYFSQTSPEALRLSEKLYFNILKKLFE